VGAALAEPIDAVQVLADAVAAMLITNPAADSQYAVVDRWAARAVVHQATGILMAQLGLGPDDAMAVLRAHAFTAATQLAQVAQNIIDGGLDLSDL
jgi:AmiR/NasT family two-component response regulator